MTRFSKTLLAVAAMGGLLSLAGRTARAQSPDDEGVIRISDCAPTQGCDVPNGCSQGSGWSGGAACGYGGSGCGHCGGAGCGYCGGAGCGHGCGGGCGARCTRHVAAVLDWFNPYGACWRSPDYGWAPPGKVPLWRRSVAYRKYFPDAWTGQPGAGDQLRVSSVYMPTDTTQLGYYYQHGPKWWPNSAMHPGVPDPSQFHQPFGAGSCGQCNGMGCPACQTSMIGGGVQGEMIVNEGTVIENGAAPPQGTIIESQPGLPVETAPAPYEAPPQPVEPPAPTPAELKSARVPALQPTPR